MEKRVIGKLKALKLAKAKPGRYGDGGGLRLVVRESGSKSWEYRFLLNGNAETMGLGSFPDISLDEARDAAHECRRLRRKGIDPREARDEKLRGEGGGVTFRQDAEDYLDFKQDGWTGPYKRKCERRLAQHVYPVVTSNGQKVADLPSAKMDTETVLLILKPIWRTKNPTATFMRLLIEAILDFSKVKKHRTGENPARWRGHLKMVLAKPSQVHKKKHFPSLDHSKAPAFRADLYRTKTCISAFALEYDMHAPVRVGVAVTAEWDELGPVETPTGVEFPSGKWSIPEEKMKGYKKIDYPDGKYDVPLTAPMIEILKLMWKIRESKWVFPGGKPGGHITAKAVLDMAKRLTTDPVTTHGFRATFETWSDACTICEDMVKEMCLGHSFGSETEKAYRRSDLFVKRRLLQEAWSNYLITGDNVAVDINARFMALNNGLMQAAD